ncbi:MAG TPA: hypothetical protein DCX60_10400 [Phycisphaerales bacterium]|nr:hypothetical protein [Phycisphaerales bacterium]
MVERKGPSRRFPLMMTHPSLTNIMAAILGIAGFLVAISAGLFSGNAMDSVLERALFCAFLCFLAGGAIGMLLDSVLDGHAQKLRIKAVEDQGPDQEEAPDEAVASPPDQSPSPQAVA